MPIKHSLPRTACPRSCALVNNPVLEAAEVDKRMAKVRAREEKDPKRAAHALEAKRAILLELVNSGFFKKLPELLVAATTPWGFAVTFLITLAMYLGIDFLRQPAFAIVHDYLAKTNDPTRLQLAKVLRC